MAQVYSFVDENGVTRLFAEIVPDPAGTPFNGGTITAPLTIQGAQTIAGLLQIHETAKTPGEYGFVVVDASSEVQIATTTTNDGFAILKLGGSHGVQAPLAVWSDYDNDSNPELQIDASHNVSIAQSTSSVGFYGHAPHALQTGVAVSAAGIHAALVNLGLITA